MIIFCATSCDHQPYLEFLRPGQSLPVKCIKIIGLAKKTLQIKVYFKVKYTLDDVKSLSINTGWLSFFRVPSTFAPANTHANVFFVFLPGGISKECRHIVLANCDFEGNYLADIV